LDRGPEPRRSSYTCGKSLTLERFHRIRADSRASGGNPSRFERTRSRHRYRPTCNVVSAAHNQPQDEACRALRQPPILVATRRRDDHADQTHVGLESGPAAAFSEETLDLRGRQRRPRASNHDMSVQSQACWSRCGRSTEGESLGEAQKYAKGQGFAE